MRRNSGQLLFGALAGDELRGVIAARAGGDKS
jgi:hypothetical protein